jgi:hypothetical protein
LLSLRFGFELSRYSLISCYIVRILYINDHKCNKLVFLSLFTKNSYHNIDCEMPKLV